MKVAPQSTCVHALVRGEVSALREARPTDVADIMLLSGVRAFVRGQVAL